MIFHFIKTESVLNIGVRESRSGFARGLYTGIRAGEGSTGCIYITLPLISTFGIY